MGGAHGEGFAGGKGLAGQTESAGADEPTVPAIAPVSSMSIREHNTVVAVASAAASGCA
jgi:hypothetical protein